VPTLPSAFDAALPPAIGMWIRIDVTRDILPTAVGTESAPDMG